MSLDSDGDDDDDVSKDTYIGEREGLGEGRFGCLARTHFVANVQYAANK